MRQKQGDEAEQGNEIAETKSAELPSADERRHRERQKDDTADIARLSSST